MPSIRLEPTGTAAGWSFSLDGEPPKDVMRNRKAVFWAVKLSPDETVRLATGNELKDLPGRVIFRVGDASPEGKTTYSKGRPVRWGGLHYIADNKSGDSIPRFPESFDVDLYVSRNLFERLESLIAAGRLPALTVTVGEESDGDADGHGIRYGWEPDGRALEWDNKRFPHLEMLWCEFEVDVGLPSSQEDDRIPETASQPPTKADLDRLNGAVASKIDRLRGSVLLALWVNAALLAMIVFRRLW